MYLILVLLQPNQPPTAASHCQSCPHNAHQHAGEARFPGEIQNSVAVSAMAKAQPYTTARSYNEQTRKRNMTPPTPLPRISSKHRKQAKNLNTK
jgi:hypothetical protein